ncbi:MAG: hypothetical protein K2P99_07025 [Burkholderiales bacterium]|nr:hypothetical protein [Burkholderiales bacterium]
MSNRLFTLTLNAIEVLEKVPKRSRSKFVSDAITNYSKKKDIFNDYLVKVGQKKLTGVISKKDKDDTIDTMLNNSQDENKSIKKKIKIDDGY